MSLANNLRKVLKEKYKDYAPFRYNEFVQAYIYDTWGDQFNNDCIILKGAFNFYKNHNYLRFEKIKNDYMHTSDIDFSIVNSSFDPIIKAIDSSVSHYCKDNEFFNFEKSEEFISDIDVATAGYKGKHISYVVYLHDDRQSKGPFEIDVAVEELPNDYGIELDSQGRKKYSIAKSLAEKYVSAIYWGDSNTRSKDFTDITSLYDLIDDKLSFYNLVKRYVEVRNINKELINNGLESGRDILDGLIESNKVDADIIRIINEINCKVF